MRERTGHPALARRFLHVCLNTALGSESVDFHRRIAGLSVGMATGVQRSTGSVLDVGADAGAEERPFVAETTFLYDHRGPRTVGALEVVHWIDPATTGEVYPSPDVPGLHAVSYAVPAVAEHVRAAGASVVARLATGLLTPEVRSTVVRDPDGVLVELLEAEPEALAEMRGVRLACRDLEASVAWYTGIGFAEAVPPTTVTTSGAAFGLEGAEATVRAARLFLVEEPSFALTVVEWPQGSGSSYDEPHHRGLFRMALRVEDMASTLGVLDEHAVRYEGPKWIPLPGTKIGGLSMVFLRDPDGVLVELVERPMSLVGKPAARLGAGTTHDGSDA